MAVTHPRLARLDRLANSMAGSGDVAAVLGLGSAGAEQDRFDDHSDIDFFVVVTHDAAKSAYLRSIDWLSAMGTVVYEFMNDVNGRKALFDDGLFIEYAVFTIEELRGFPLAGARTIWRRPEVEADLGADAPAPSATSLDTVEFHLNEALTNLYVGLHRELRGERLTASRFIQVFAIDRILALVRLTTQAQRLHPDLFDPTRRVETAYPALADALRHMVLGYEGNVLAARTILEWLTDHFTPDQVITARIDALISEAEGHAPSTDFRR